MAIKYLVRVHHAHGDTLAWSREASAAGSRAQRAAEGDAKGLVVGYFLITSPSSTPLRGSPLFLRSGQNGECDRPAGLGNLRDWSLLGGKWCGDCVNGPLTMTKR
jgi:hypothetical protein